MTDTTSTRPQMGDELREILAHELARRYGDDSPSVKYLREGIDKFVMPEGSQDLIAAALAAMSRVRASLPQPTAGSTGEVDGALVNYLRRASAAVYIAMDAIAADDLSPRLNAAADTIERLSTPAQSVLVEAATHNGFIVGNGAKVTKWMHWDNIGPVWKDDPWTALRFARREDAEAFAAENEDAWYIIPLADALSHAPSQPAPVVDTGPKWQRYDHEDKSTWPTQVGVYRVMVSLEGHTIYEYPDYPTWTEAFEDEDDDGEEIVMFGQGMHDEEADTFFAYCGPISIPVFSEKALTPPQATEEKS